MAQERKRYSTTELVVYSMSNTTRTVYFDTLEEAMDFARKQREAHPRTKKLNGAVYDHLDNKYHRI